MSPLYIPLISYLLRIGLGLSYITFAIFSFYTPETLLLNAANLINIYHPVIQTALAAFSVAMAIWIFSGKRLMISSSLSIVFLILLFIGNIKNPFVIFTILQLLCSTVALATCERIDIFGHDDGSDDEIIKTAETRDVKPVESTEKIPEIAKPIEPEEAVPTIH